MKYTGTKKELILIAICFLLCCVILGITIRYNNLARECNSYIDQIEQKETASQFYTAKDTNNIWRLPQNGTARENK